MHLVAGFESRIAAYGAVLDVSAALRARGAEISGAGLARRDAERGIHVDPIQGFDLPPHILAALDLALESDGRSDDLRPGRSALVVSSPCSEGVFAVALEASALDRHGPLWAIIVAPNRTVVVFDEAADREPR